jgi:hypothetical protein
VEIVYSNVHTASYLLGAGGADDSVDDEAGLNGVDPNRSSLNGSAFCGVVPLLCVCVRLDESLGTFGGGATVKKIIPITLMFQHSYASTHVPTYMKKYRVIQNDSSNLKLA